MKNFDALFEFSLTGLGLKDFDALFEFSLTGLGYRSENEKF